MKIASFLSAIVVATYFCGHASAYPVPYTCSRNFYVATTGSDSAGCGTSQANACASIQGANNNIALQGGDCVHVAAGTYKTSNTIKMNRHGSSNQANGYIAYTGAPNHASKILYTTGGSLFRGIDVTGSSYIAIDGFEFDGNNGTVPGQMITNDQAQGRAGAPHHLMIINNLIHDSRAGGV